MSTYICPKCKHTDLDVCISTWARIDQDDPDNVMTDADDAQDTSHEWDSNSLMQCRHCYHADHVKLFATTLQTAIERAKVEILADIKAGHVPAPKVSSFSDLHDYVDANGYGGAFDGEGSLDEEAMDFWNDVQDAVDQWIKSGYDGNTLKEAPCCL